MDRGVLSNVAEALDRAGGLRGVNAELLHSFADEDDDAEAGGFGAAQGTAAANGLAGNGARNVFAAEDGVFIHEPAHILSVGAHVRGRDVDAVTESVIEGADITADQTFAFADGEIARINNDAALAAAERDVRDGAFPGHLHGQHADSVDGFVGSEAETAFVRAQSVVVLYAEAVEDLQGAVIHADRDADVIFFLGGAAVLAGFGIQIEHIGDSLELLEGDFK